MLSHHNAVRVGWYSLLHAVALVQRLRSEGSSLSLHDFLARPTFEATIASLAHRAHVSEEL